jgi:hypothetical protein
MPMRKGSHTGDDYLGHSTCRQAGVANKNQIINL